MDASLLADTISDILQCTSSSLAPPATRLSAKDIKHFADLLQRIHVTVQQSPNDLTWLQKVKEVVNDLKDLMEDLLHNKESNTTTTWLFKTGQNMAHRLKLTHQIKKAEAELESLATEAENFPNQARKNERKLPNMETFEAVGRENDKKEIIDQLNENIGEENVSVCVVTIVGVAGIGKTKLARLVCGDDQVKAHFGSPIWVHVGETLDVESIAKRVTTNGGKRFLLVLDDLRSIDVFDQCHMKLLQKLTGAGQFGGAILITTRSNVVANKIAATVSASAGTVKLHALQGLNQEESWCLFRKIRGEGSSDINKNIEGEIVREYCGVVPLAIITIARLLNSRESPVSKAQVEVLKKEFLTELKFTYYDQLPAHQKRCFAYCSLFPQQHLINAERLIHLWMAEGFLWRNLSSNDDPQEFGLACFKDFVPFVFKEEEKNEFGVARSYRMNPLMHELARIVAWDENIIVDSEGKRVHDRVLRASFDYALDMQCGMPESLFEKAKKLRTILLLAKTNKSRLPHEVKMTTSTCDKILESFKCLRVLDLHDLGIKMVPSSIGEVKHLRYLDLSNNNIEKLPIAITKLFHLQTLKLSQCHVLKELPKEMDDLSSLRHLDLEGCLDLTHIPRGIGKLSSLQTLSLFVASKNYNMGGLGELTDLSILKGHLEILHLEQLKVSGSASLDAKDKYLKNKEHLRCLTLRWDHDEDENEGNDEGSLQRLEPNPNLRVLFVVGYNSNKFSDWLSSIQCLVKFSLNDCPKCEFLPPLDQLAHLRVLELRRLDSLEFIDETSSSGDTQGSSSSTSIDNTPFFPSLKELTISDCPELKSWWKNEKRERRPFFTCISKLHVQCCPKLDCMPLYPYLDEELVLVDSSAKPMRDTIHAETSEDFLPFSKLKSMLIERIEESPPETWLKNFISLENLHIRDCSHLESLPQGFNRLSSLQCLTIERCPELDLDKSKDEWEGLKNLRSLTVKEIRILKSLPWGVENVTSLQELGLDECSALTFLPESIGNLTSLGKLVISECKSLDSLPKAMEKLKSLKTLIITDCPLLLPRCQPETGDDWPQIGHISNILLKQSSQDLRDLWNQGRTRLGKDLL